MVWGCISAYGMGSLHVLEGTMNAERYIKVLEQHMLPSTTSISGKAMCISAGQCKTTYCSFTTAWLHSRRVRALNWPACSPDLSPIKGGQSWPKVRPLSKALNPQLLPGRRSIGCQLLRVCVHGVCGWVKCRALLGWVKCRAQIPSMGHHTWPQVTSFPFSYREHLAHH